MESRLLSAVMFMWQLPQHIVAGGIFIYLMLQKGVLSTGWYNGKRVVWTEFTWGVSLGEFIFLGEIRNRDGGITLLHEYGHCLQSMLFGPWYLLVIGIPSAVFNNLWDRLFHRKWDGERRVKWYYSRYPERWADKLGGVRRPWQRAANRGMIF